VSTRFRERVPRLGLLLGLLAGCDALLGISEPIDGGAGDTGPTMSPTDAAVPDDARSADAPPVDAPPVDAPPIDAPPVDARSSNCDDAACSVLLTAAVNVTSLWANATNVLWTTADGGVYGCALPACSPVLTIATGRPGPTSVLPSSSGDVYWAEGAGQGPAFCKDTGCDGGVSYVTGTQAASLLTTATYNSANWLVWFDTSLGVDDCQLPSGCAQGASVRSSVTASPVSFFSGDGKRVYWASGSTLGGMMLDGTAIPTATPAGTVGGLAAGTPLLWTDPSGLNSCPPAGCSTAVHLAPAPAAAWTPGAVVRGGIGNAYVFWSGVSGLLDCQIVNANCPSSPFAATGIPTVSVLAASKNAVFWAEPTGIWYARAPL
jgi:hypothetical protein